MGISGSEERKGISEGPRSNRTINVTHASAVQEHGEAPARLSRIHFEGVGRTKAEALHIETKRLFAAANLKELVMMAYQARQHIVEMGLFKGAEVVLDVDPDASAPAHAYEATFVVSESRRAVGSVWGTLNHRGEAETTLSLQGRNIGGRGERVTADVTRNYNATFSKWHLGFHKPFLGWQRYAGAALNIGRGYTEAPWSKFYLVDNSLSAELYHHPHPYLKQQVKWTGAWRYLSSLTDGTSWLVREHSGHSLKSSLEHCLSYSTLDSPIVPNQGLLARLTTEWAGFGGDVAFLRNDLELGFARRLIAGIVMSGNLSMTGVSAYSGPSLHMADRCFLGGPYNLRGFGLNAVGDAQDGCALGGDASWLAGLHLYRPLYPPRVFFAHAFAVAGNLHPVDNTATGWRVVEELLRNPRASVGVGLVVNLLDKIRLELNYAMPIRPGADDVAAQGFQFGAGISFV